MRFKRKVWVRKYDNQKMITIPKDSDLKSGDYVWIEKVNNSDNDKTGE